MGIDGKSFHLNKLWASFSLCSPTPLNVSSCNATDGYRMLLTNVAAFCVREFKWARAPPDAGSRMQPNGTSFTSPVLVREIIYSSSAWSQLLNSWMICGNE
jgi:hypothetical protein